MLYTLSVAGISLSDAEYLITKAGGLCGKNPFSTKHGLALDTVGREFFELAVRLGVHSLLQRHTAVHASYQSDQCREHDVGCGLGFETGHGADAPPMNF